MIPILLYLVRHNTELQQTEDAHAADQNFLNDLTEKCETKAKDWDSRSTTRSAELKTIADALELLKGDVSKMSAGESCESTMGNVKGKGTRGKGVRNVQVITKVGKQFKMLKLEKIRSNSRLEKS